MKDQKMIITEEKEKINNILTKIQNLNKDLKKSIDSNQKFELSNQLIKNYSLLRNGYAILNANQDKDYSEIITQSIKQEINDLEKYSLDRAIKKKLVHDENEIKILIELIDLKYKHFWEYKPQILSRKLR